MIKFNWKSEEELEQDAIDGVRSVKEQEIRQDCNEAITSFKYTLSDINYIINYELENQQNFSDTIRLFDNGMIDTIEWNLHKDGEKIIKTFTEQEFRDLYIYGITWKTNCRRYYNTQIIPHLNSLNTISEIKELSWDSNDVPNSLDLDSSNTLAKKVSELDQKTTLLEKDKL